jgi:transposase
MAEPEQAQSTKHLKKVYGLDAHPTMFSLALISGEDALQARTDWVVDRQPLDRLVELIEKRTEQGAEIAMEASGNSFEIAERIEACGRRPVVLESQSVGKVGKTYCATVRVDAIKIARVWFSGLAHVVWRPDPRTRELRQMFFAHRNAVEDSTRARNRLWAWFNDLSVKQPGQKLLARTDALPKLLALKPFSECQQSLLADMVSDYQRSEARRKRLRSVMASELASNADMRKLIRVLGIRTRVAFALVAFIGDIRRFATHRKLVAYFGLNPFVSRSGKGGGTGSLAKCGRSDVRTLLIQAAQAALRYGKASVHRWALALKMRKGKPLAVAALARKIVVAVWYLLNGLVAALKEPDATLKRKVHKIALEIGASALKRTHHRTLASFEEELLQKIVLGT